MTKPIKQLDFRDVFNTAMSSIDGVNNDVKYKSALFEVMDAMEQKINEVVTKVNELSDNENRGHR